MIGLVIFLIVVGVAGFLLLLRLALKSKPMPVQGANEEFNFIIALITKAANIQILERANNRINAFIYRYRQQIPMRDMRWYEHRLHTALNMKLVEFGNPEIIAKHKSFAGNGYSSKSKQAEQYSAEPNQVDSSASNHDKESGRANISPDEFSDLPVEVEKIHRGKN